MARGFALVAAIFVFLGSAKAAKLDGIFMPDEQIVHGTRLQLNGIGIRTYSIFRIRIYVAGLYLERRSDSPDSIIHSDGPKLLIIHFLHNVTAEQARTAWQDGFKQNCRSPCYLDPRDVESFLAHVPPAREGDSISLVFTSKGARVTDNGRPLGSIDDPHFANVMLETFIGPAPPTPQLKRGLLGLAG